MSKISLWEAIGSPANFPNYDSRTGLGYGTNSGFHSSRKYQGTYPYKEPVEGQFLSSADEDDQDDEDLDLDDEDLQFSFAFRNKVSTNPPVDPYAVKKTDPYYYYGSATPTGMFGEAIGMNRSKGSISPKPNLYKNKQAVSGDGYVGASIRPFQTIIHRSSTPHGYSKAPIPLDSEVIEDDKTLLRLRELIRMYHKANLSRE